LLFLVLILKLNIKSGEHLEDSLFVSVHDVSTESDDWLHDELNEASLEVGAIVSNLINFPLLALLVIEVVAPKLLHHLVEVYLELVGIDLGESGKGEGPSEKSGTEGHGTLGGVDLLSLSHVVSLVG